MPLWPGGWGCGGPDADHLPEGAWRERTAAESAARCSLRVCPFTRGSSEHTCPARPLRGVVSMRSAVRSESHFVGGGTGRGESEVMKMTDSDED